MPLAADFLSKGLQMSVGVTSDAIFFLDGNVVVKEMLYPEFEAILDHVVGIHEFKDTKASAVYLQINTQLYITAAVFFTIDFDASGYVDKSWNIPLQHLAANTGPGPDLGAGPIKLACRSQCSVAWHQRLLWDPLLDAGDNNTLTLLAKAAQRNRLGLTFDEANGYHELDLPSASAGTANDSKINEIEAKLKKKYRKELQDRTTALVDEQKLRIAAMKSEAQDYIDKVQQHYKSERQKLNETLNSTKQLFAEEKHKNLQLKNTLNSQAQDLRQARERFQEEIEHSKAVEQDQLLALEERFELEAKAQIDAAKTELKEMLDMREVELFYRDEQVKRLNEEISLLRQEKQALLDGGGNRVLHKLVAAGITFVAYQPGVDHLTIPLHEMSDYLDSPMDFVADKCAVDKELYQQWINHHELPVCNHPIDDHSVCGNPIPKTDKPSRFIVGESDRCAKHNHTASALSEIIKKRGASC